MIITVFTYNSISITQISTEVFSGVGTGKKQRANKGNKLGLQYISPFVVY